MVYNLFNIYFFCILLFCVHHLPHSFRWVIFLFSGVFFIHSYSPPSLGLVLPVALGVVFFFFRDIQGYIKLALVPAWFLLWLLSFVFLYRVSAFTNTHFQFELLVLGFYNLGRILHVLIDGKKIRFVGLKPQEAIAYFFYPPILFSGPMETIQDFMKFHRKKDSPVQWKKGFELIFYGFLLEGVAILCQFFFQPKFHQEQIPVLHLILYVYSIGWTIHFRLSGYISFTRGFSTLMGYPFTSRNFYDVYSSGSVAGFWSRWNMSVSRWALKYVLGEKVSDFTQKKFLLTVFVYFATIGFLHGMNIQYSIWGILMGGAIVLNILYMSLKFRLQTWMLWDKKYFSRGLKVFLTMNFMHWSCLFLVPEWRILIQKLFGI